MTNRSSRVLIHHPCAAACIGLKSRFSIVKIGLLIIMRFKLLLITLCLLNITACADDSPSVTLAGERFYVDIADDDSERTRGLMFVEQMADNKGMLFLFPDERRRSFWMKNTKIPLDIFYFNAEFKLVSVSENARPCRTAQCSHYPSSGPAKYVLELNAGKAEQLGVEAGSQLSLHNVH